jgi:hypothetical protein
MGSATIGDYKTREGRVVGRGSIGTGFFLTVRSEAYPNLRRGMFTAHMTDEGTADNPENTISRYGVGVMLRSEKIRDGLMTDETAGRPAAQRHRAHGSEGGRRSRP